MRYLLITLFMFFLHSDLCAQTVMMNLKLKDGSIVSFSIENINKIIFTGVVTGIKADNTIENVVETFSLFQNYPNPFNPSTTIQYKILQPGSVNLSIFNLTGQKVKEFEFESQPAGTHSFVWDGRDRKGRRVASGLYIYSVKFGNSVITKKMMVLK